MPYATQQDMVDRFGEVEIINLTDRADPPAGVIDADVLDRALTDAADEIDAYVGARHPLPLVSVPPVLARVACDVTRYRLSDDCGVLTEEVENRYKNALRFLRDVSAGRVNLGASSAPIQIDSPKVSAPDRVFTYDTLKDF